MYYKIKFNFSVKFLAKNVYDDQSRTFSFNAGDVVEGRIDTVGGRTLLVLSDGYGGTINKDFVSKV